MKNSSSFKSLSQQYWMFECTMKKLIQKEKKNNCAYTCKSALKWDNQSPELRQSNNIIGNIEFLLSYIF